MIKAGDILRFARAYHGSGLTVLPLAGGAKKPPRGMSTTALREKPQRVDDLPTLFSRDDCNIGIFGGSVSHDVVILDTDSREKWRELDRISVFRKLKANTPIVPTRRGFHTYLFAPFTVAKSRAEHWQTDIQGEGCYAVAPPSEVRSEHGGKQLYLWDGTGFRPIYRPSQEEWRELAEIFNLRPVQDGPLDPTRYETGTVGTFYGLGIRAWEALRKPEKTGNRSEKEQIPVFRAVSIGWSFEDIHALFAQHAAPATKYRERERAGYGEKWLKVGYKNALLKYSEIAAPRARMLNAAIDHLAFNTPFQGVGRFTDAAVLKWILHVERLAGIDRISISIRSIAEGTGKGFATVRDSLERLQEAGALNIISSNAGGLVLTVPESFIATALLAKPINIDTLTALRGDEGEAGRESSLLAKPINIDTLSTLRAESSFQSKATATPPGGHTGFTIVPASHDAFRRGALGSTGPHLIHALNAFSCQPFTVSSLMDKGFAFRYIRKALALLLKAEVVASAGEQKAKHGKPVKLYSCPHSLSFSALDAIAKAAGTTGAGERQRERYKKDREAMKRWKEREGRT